MKKKILILIPIFLIALIFLAPAKKQIGFTGTRKAATPSVKTEGLVNQKQVVTDTETATESSYPDWTDKQVAVHEIAEQARSIGLDENNPIIREASRIWWEDEAVDVSSIPKEVEALSYTDDELRILANVVFYEAPYCNDRHQRLVAQVVLNRVADPRFPDTIAAVVAQPGQYSDGYLYAWPNGEEYERCKEAAKDALEGRVECPSNVIFQANFRQGTGIYEICDVDTGWFRSTTYFCYG